MPHLLSMKCNFSYPAKRNLLGIREVFVGTTRDNFDGKEVVLLEYEAYEEMAARQIQKVISRARIQHPEVLSLRITGSCEMNSIWLRHLVVFYRPNFKSVLICKIVEKVVV